MEGDTASRESLKRLREHLDEWTYDARDRAFDEFFDGEDARVSADDLRTIDAVDSDLERRGDDGLWGTDEYGIVPIGRADEETTPRVVCVRHPEIPGSGYRGTETLSESDRDRLNDALWEYCERVAALIQSDLDEFVTGAETAEGSR